MCLAVPGAITRIIDTSTAEVDMLGATRNISLRLVPEARVGDFVLVHAGFGIQIIDPEEARETIEFIREMDELVAEELPAPDGATA